jgi:hypothetical protein
MAVVYDIFPDLNLVIYVCIDDVTPAAFFRIGDQVALDVRFRAHMNIIIDFQDAELETVTSDLKLAIKKYQHADQSGQPVGRTAILTKSKAMIHLGEALKIISLESITNFGIFHRGEDVVHWLELPIEQTLACWSMTRARLEVEPF